ncbi:MAG: hypothetical protein N2Z65_01490 [Clostridiales bacterium]|nr:hypothetical protein [Clostridiales bacterium]
MKSKISAFQKTNYSSFGTVCFIISANDAEISNFYTIFVIFVLDYCDVREYN